MQNFWEIYQHNKKTSNILSVVELGRETHGLATQANAAVASFLSIFGPMLEDLFKASHNSSDIDDSIIISEKAIEAASVGGQSRPDLVLSPAVRLESGSRMQHLLKILAWP